MDNELDWKVGGDDTPLEPTEEMIANIRALSGSPWLERSFRLYLGKLRAHDAEIRPLPPHERTAFRARLAKEASDEARGEWLDSSRSRKPAITRLRDAIGTALASFVRST